MDDDDYILNFVWGTDIYSCLFFGTAFIFKCYDNLLLGSKLTFYRLREERMPLVPLPGNRLGINGCLCLGCSRLRKNEGTIAPQLEPFF